MNGVVWQGIYNVLNSYTSIEMTMQAVQGMTHSSGHAADDIFIGRVKVLEDIVRSIDVFDSIYLKDVEKRKGEDPVDFHHRKFTAILTFLRRNHHVRFKPPRDFADD